jgi:hypothetical protein
MSVPKECSICYDEIGERNNCVTNCGHQFCFNCIVTSLQHSNVCPYCRTQLIEIKSEQDNDPDEIIEEVEGDDEEDETEDTTDIEDIVVRLQERGVTMLDVVSLLVGRYSKTRDTNIDIEERIETLHGRVWNVIVEMDDETIEQNKMQNEDINSLAIELSRPKQFDKIANLINEEIRNTQIK